MLAIACALCIPLPAAAARRVLVVSNVENDARIDRVREAIAYWREVFTGLDLEPELIDTGVAVKPSGARAIENFAWQISRLAGRLPENTDQPPPPAELLALDSDVVILLSTQPLLPFARPLAERRRYLVAIPRARATGDSGPDPNVIAHELGHVLGLEHGDDATALMCEPCPSASGSDADFRPLSAGDRARLIELYGKRAP